jgi:tricarballylate dehydrogenase
MAERSEDVDVVVVGGGSAAFASAVSARQHGAERVVMLEKAPEADFGGNARFSSGGFKFAHQGTAELLEFVTEDERAELADWSQPAYTTDEFLKDIELVQNGRVYWDLAETLVHESNATMHWMHQTGIRFKIARNAQILESSGRGFQQLHTWREIATGLGIEIRYDSPVVALHGDHRRVEGVHVDGPEGTYDLRGRSVILCSGGFQASAELRARYMGAYTAMLKVLGSRYDTGEVLLMALRLGAAASGDWNQVDASSVSPTPMAPGTIEDTYRRGYQLSVTVNRRAERFMDEGPSMLTTAAAGTRTAMSRVQMELGFPELVMSQPGGVVYQIFDQKAVPLLDAGYGKDITAEADTIPELATKLGLDPARLQATITQFNQAVRDDVAFDPKRPDGRSTVGLTPAKSNWALRVDQPPYVAYAATFGVTMSLGGVRVNTCAQVLNVSGAPIKGLYASGDIIGMYFTTHLSGTGQTRNAVFGRIAGRHAVRGA